MKNLLLIAALFVGGGTGSDTLPGSEPWRAMAAGDLAFIHRVIADHHPGPLDTANAWFAEWHERGYSESVARVDSVRSYGGYRAVLQRYIAGFRDGHLNINLSLDYRWTGWPGFGVVWRDGHAIVGHVEPGLDAPAPGDRLVSCDGASAERLYQERVRPFAGRDIPADRHLYIPRLLLDQVNPLLADLSACVFERDGARQAVSLDWRWVPRPQLEGLPSPGASSRPAFQQWETGGGEGLWIRLPTFGPRGEALKTAQTIFDGLPDQRTRDYIVLDLRSNGGGSSFWAGELVRQLHGEAWWTRLEAELDSDAYATHRVSAGNVEHFRNLLPRVAAETGEGSRFHRHFVALADRMAEAFDDGIEMLDFHGVDEVDEAEGPGEAALSPAQPRPRFTGRLVLLTDGVCASACLDFADVVLALPNTLHVGQPTGADTHYMEVRGLSLPSRNGRLNFATKVYRNRSRGHNEWYEPKHLWTGDMGDTEGLEAWVSDLLEDATD